MSEIDNYLSQLDSDDDQIIKPSKGFTPDSNAPKEPNLDSQIEGLLKDSPAHDRGFTGALIDGAKSTGRAISSTYNTYTGDGQAVFDNAKAQELANEDKNQDIKNFQSDWAANTGAGTDEEVGLWGAIKGTGKAIVDNPRGAALSVVEQFPNSVPTLAAGWAGAKGGAMAGGAVGSAFAGVGAAPGAVIGGITGFVGGMFLGNTLTETGYKAQEYAADGEFTPDEQSAAITEGAKKAGVITAVDALTFAIGGKVSSTMRRTAESAVEAATRKTLLDAGVDISDTAALTAARSNPQIASQVVETQKNAAKIADNLRKRAGEVGALLTMETVGEGLGEYLGELAATGQASVSEAVLESFLSLGQSGVQTMFNLAKARDSSLTDQEWVDAANGIAPEGIAPEQLPVADGIWDEPTPEAKIDMGQIQDGGVTPTPVFNPQDIDRNLAPTPSQQMGINPNAGPLSAAAAQSVDSGLFAGGFTPQAGINQSALEREGVTPPPVFDTDQIDRNLGSIDPLTGEYIEAPAKIGSPSKAGKAQGNYEYDQWGNLSKVDGRAVEGYGQGQPRLGFNNRPERSTAPSYEVGPDGVARPTTGEKARSMKERVDLSTLGANQKQAAPKQQAQQPAAQRTPEQDAQSIWDNLNTFERNAAATKVLGMRGVPAKNTATKAWGKLSPKQQAKLTAGLDAQQGQRWTDPNQKVADQTGPVLQNRDRTSQDSIMQMRGISNNPDYNRLKTSGFLSDGAPVVINEKIQVPESQLGVTDTASAGDQKFNVQYAAVEADQLATSNNIDGTVNPDYATGPDGKARAIAGNGRVTGLQSAWSKGNASQYKADMAADRMHGIDPAVIEGMRNPILVRLLPQDQVTDNIGDLSNRDEKGRLTPVEQAKTDIGRIDLDSLKFTAEGAVGGEAIHQFRMAQPAAERVSEAEARKRLTSAIFQKAYGNDQLTEIQSGESDDAKSIMSALAQAAPSMSRLEGAGEFDVRPLITQAGIAAVNAARRGTKLADYVQQSEMGIDPMVYPILEMMLNEHGNIRSSKYIGEQLTNMAKLAYDEANSPSSDMFGEKPKRTADQVIQDALTGVQGYGQINDGRGQESLGQRGRSEPDAQMVEGPEGERERPADTRQAAPAQPEAEQGQPATVENEVPGKWRTNYMRAAKVARDLGIDPKQHKKLDDLVAAIDAFNAEPVASQPNQQVAAAKPAADSKTGVLIDNATDMTSALAAIARGAQLSTEPNGDVILSGTKIITLPKQPTSVDEVIGALAVALRDQMRADGVSMPSNPADMTRDQFVVAYEFANIIPEFEITGEDIGGVVQGSSSGLTVDADKLYDKIIEQSKEQANPALELNQQTEESLAKDAKRLEQLQKEEAAQKAKQKAAESKARERDADKARADEVVDDFQLGQSAEEVMSGMGDFFDDKTKKPIIKFSRNNNQPNNPTTNASLLKNINDSYPALTDSVVTMLQRGRKGQKGGLVIVGSNNGAVIAKAYSKATGMPIAQANRLFSDGESINGFYDPKSGITFLVGPNLDATTAPAVLLHEVTHSQQRSEIDDRSMKLINGRAKEKNADLKTFLETVSQRMIDAGEDGNALESTSYIVEQAIIEGRSQGYTLADSKFFNAIEKTLGATVANIVRDFTKMVRQFALRRGLPINITIDDLVQYAMASVEQTAKGNIATENTANQAQQFEDLRMSLKNAGASVRDTMTVDQLISSDRIPTLTISDLEGMTIFPTIADRTAAAAIYTGIDSSQLQVAIPLLGGPNFPLRESNAESGVVWANRGSGVTGQKAARLKAGASHMMIVMGDANMHQSNTTVSNAFFETLSAYVRDKRITKKNADQLTRMVRQSSTADPQVNAYMASFPGLADQAKLDAYLHRISFTARRRLLDLLGTKRAQALGAPSMTKVLDATREPSLAGQRWGDGVLLVEVDQVSPMVNLGEQGTQPHPDFPLGIRGKVAGRLEAPVNYEILWKDWIDSARENAISRGTPESKVNVRRAFELAKPAITITPDLIARIGSIKQSNIDGPRQARLAADFAADNWKTSDQPVNRGGVSPQEFADAIQNSDAYSTLTPYTATELKAGIKAGTMRLFQLGQDGQIFFMLETRPDGSVELASVVNNEQGARGIGAPAVLLKAIEEGATDLTAFAVANEKYPAGFLPTLYKSFGFDVTNSMEFDARYFRDDLPKRARDLVLQDAVKYWTDSTPGFNPDSGMPSVVEMTWRGTDADRANITERYFRGGLEGLLAGRAEADVRTFAAIARAPDQQTTQRAGSATDTGRATGTQGAGNRTPVPSRAQRVVSGIAELNDTELRNLGLTTADRDAARAATRSDGPRFSLRGREQAGDRGGRVASRGLAPLPMAPSIQGFSGPDSRLVDVAEQYARANGIDLRRQSEYVDVDPARAARIADAYEAMPHVPQDPAVREAYENLIQQTRAQYDALVAAGYQFWFIDPSSPEGADYLDSPWNAMRDIRENQSMGSYPTDSGFGSGDFNPEENPLLADTGIQWPVGSPDGKAMKPVYANDLFRVVHDAFGHGLEGSGFRARGEENAWQAHVRLFTGSAVGAITTETRGQNSWLNYGPHGERNRNAQVEDTIFADQKTGLMPEWTWTEGRAGDMPAEPRFSLAPPTESAAFKRWFDDSKVVDAQGNPLVMYHGSNADISEFITTGGRGKTYGTGAFFTSSPYTANTYVAGGGGGNVTPVYVSLKNPVVVDGDGAYWNRLGANVRVSLPTITVSDLDNERLAAELEEREVDWDASVTREALSASLGEMFPGELQYDDDALSTDDLARWARSQGYDGVVFQNVVDRGPSGRFADSKAASLPSTLAVAFRPEQIKSAVGNNGNFDPANQDIRFSRSQTKTPAFKKWFGNSKVVDANGEPMVVYHGAANFDGNVFRPVATTNRFGNVEGFYFGGAGRANQFASAEGGEVIPVYLSITNPFVPRESKVGRAMATAYRDALREANPSMSEQRFNYWADGKVEELLERRRVDVTALNSRGDLYQRTLRAGGYDGMRDGDDWVAFRPEQIKSAVGNVGAYGQRPVTADEAARFGMTQDEANEAQGRGDIRFSMKATDKAYADAVEAGDMQAAQEMVIAAAKSSGVPLFNEEGVTAYTVRRDKAPRRTEKAYKLFRVKRNSPGELFALFVGANDPLPQGAWLDAVAGPESSPSKTGKRKVKSKLGDLAYRPGWHAGDTPLATHIGAKNQDGQVFARKDDEVWAEVEMAYDVDYQPQADANGRTKSGAFSAALADIKEMPVDGMYRYKTNPAMTGSWIISGSMRINRVLSEQEVNGILAEAGQEAMPWAGQQKGSRQWETQPLDLDRWGLGTNPAMNQKKLLDPVTYDDEGNVIPLSKRFNQGGSDPRFSIAPQKQGDMFSSEFAGKRAKGNINSDGNQVAQTKQALNNFKSFFSDSKAVDQDGRPLVMYHSTNADITQFEQGRKTKNNMGILGDVETARDGIFVTPDREFSQEYLRDGDGQNVMPLYLSAKNPADLRNGVTEEISNKLSSVGYNARNLKNLQSMWEAFDHGYEGYSELVKSLKDAGYDSAIISEEGRDGVEHDTYVAFDSSQLKSVTGNQGSYRGGDVNFSRPANPASIGAAPNGMAAWDSPSASKFDDFVYKIQDKHVDTKRVIAAIRDTGKAINDDLDVYLQETLFHGRAAKRTQDFLNKEVNPLIEYMQSAKVEMSDLEEFLHARHAQEANALIAKRDPNMPDGGSGMTNAEAANYLNSLNGVRRRQFENAAKMVDKIIGGTRETIVNYGLESQETVDGWTAGFKHYIPLQREDKDGQMGIGQGFSVKGKETKSRTGSTRKVVDILANVMMQRERIIVRGEKNRVAVAALGLAKDNPLPDFWQVDKVPTTRVLDKVTGLVRNQADPMYKSRDNAIVAKVNGQEHAILMNEDDPRAMRMAEALKNLDAAQLEGLLGATATATRYFAAVNTQYNPIFGVTNFVRDIQEAMLHLQSTPLAGQQARLFKNTFTAVRAVMKAERDGRKGNNATGAWGVLWEDFQNTGGQTGFRDQFSSSADRGEAIKSALTPDGWAETGLGKFFTANGALKAPLEVVRKKAAWLFDLLSDYNTAMENGVRLSAYETGINAGMSKEQAAALAKGLTVNFNRKGQVTQQVGALYAFFNASVQGTARLGQSLFDMDAGKPKTLRLSSLGKKIVSGGVMLGASQAVLLAMAGFDDEEPPEFIRERNIIIPTGEIGRASCRERV